MVPNQDLERIIQQYNYDVGSARFCREQIDRLSERIKLLTEDTAEMEAARALIARTAESQVEGVSKYLEGVVTSALRHVFGSEFAFHIEWDRTKNSTGTVDFFVESPYGADDKIVDDPKDARGGGVQNVVDFALWITILYLAGNSGTIILDEPWHWLSQQNLPAMAEFLREIQEKLGWQVVMVTSHQLPELNQYSDKVFRVVKERGASKVIQD